MGGRESEELLSMIRELPEAMEIGSCLAAYEELGDQLYQGGIDAYNALRACAAITHAACGLRDNWHYYDFETLLQGLRWTWSEVAGRRVDSVEAMGAGLLERLCSLPEGDRRDACIAWLAADIAAMPAPHCRLKYCLGIQIACADAILTGRGSGIGTMSVFSSLEHSYQEGLDYLDLDTYANAPSEEQEGFADLAMAVEAELYRAVIRDGRSFQWADPPKDDSKEALQRTEALRRKICSDDVFQSYLEERDEVYLDQASLFQYRLLRPGEAVLIGCLADVDSRRERFVVPGRVGGNAVLRVEYVPDVRCDTLWFDEGIREIDLKRFRGECGEIVLPCTLNYVGERCFCGLQALQSVVIKGETSIRSQAFAKCANLRRVTFGPKLWSILDRAFEDCVKLGELRLPETHLVAEDAFLRSGLETVVLGNVQKLYNRAFGDCQMLREVHFTGNIEELKWNPFEGCSGLRKVVIDDGIDSLKVEDGTLYHLETEVISAIFNRDGDEDKIISNWIPVCVVHGDD